MGQAASMCRYRRCRYKKDKAGVLPSNPVSLSIRWFQRSAGLSAPCLSGRVWPAVGEARERYRIK